MIRFLNNEELISLKYAILKYFNDKIEESELEKIAKENKTNFLYFNLSTKEIEIAWIYDIDKIENDLTHEIIHKTIFELEGKEACILYDCISDRIEEEKSASILKILEKI